MEQLSLETVIIVACVCGSVVVILSVVLIVLCCRRARDAKYYYEKPETILVRPSDGALLERHAADVKSSPTNNSSSCNDDVISGCKCSSNESVDVITYPKKVQNTATGEGDHDNKLLIPAIPDCCILGSEDVTNSGTETSRRPKKIIYEVIV